MNSYKIKQAVVLFFSSILIVGLIAIFLYMPRLMNYFRKEKSITILAWPTVLDAEYVKDFEKQTGVRVYLRYFESNEELFVKLKATQGRGYDLIMPSDYTADLLIKEGILKKIDKTQFTFWDDIYPELLGNYHDPLNEYTVPYFWGVFGVGVDIDHFNGKLPPATWKLIFDENMVPKHIGVMDDIRELALIAAQYLFGSIDNLDQDKIEQIKQLLLKQKKWVEMYTDERTGYLLGSKTCPVVTSTSGDISRVMRYFDYIHFLVPQEGSFVVIDSFAVPKKSDKDEYIYAFLNYLYNPQVLSKYIQKLSFLPPVKTVSPVYTGKGISMPTAEIFKKLDFFRNVISKKQLNEIMIALKA